jgi:hypothetical protein
MGRIDADPFNFVSVKTFAATALQGADRPISEI